MKNFSLFRLLCTLTLALLPLAGTFAQQPDSTATDTLHYRPLFETEAPAVRTQRRKIRTRPEECGTKMMMDRRGNAWKTYNVDGLKVLMNVRYQQHFGRYYRIDLYIENDTDSPVLYDFNHTRISSLAGPVPLFSHDRYLGRIRSRKSWKTFGISTGALFASLFVAGILDSDSGRGRADSVGEEILQDLASITIQEAGYIASALITEKEAEDMARIVHRNVGYLGTYNIPAGTALEGHAYAKYRPGAECIDITLPIGGKDYIFQWDTRSLVSVAEDD